MFRLEMPRVYELQDLINNRSAPDAYFQDFENSVRDFPLKKQVWLAREREFQRLDDESWDFLKKEALPYLTARDKRRGWQQLISILNQARAHNYLIDEGCIGVRFIPTVKKKGQKTPDLEGVLHGTTILCEVKTVGISEEKAIRRQTGGGGYTSDSLDIRFLNKLMAHLLAAKNQMESFGSAMPVRRIAFVVLNFDDPSAEYKVCYFEQTDRHLAANPVPGIDIVFFNERTAFDSRVVMNHAAVVNE